MFRIFGTVWGNKVQEVPNRKIDIWLISSLIEFRPGDDPTLLLRGTRFNNGYSCVHIIFPVFTVLVTST
jgi:hypothetical protein